MSNYNKLLGSGIGGGIGMVLAVIFVALFNYFEVQVTNDTRLAIEQLSLAIGTLIGGSLGTYIAPKNTE